MSDDRINEAVKQHRVKDAGIHLSIVGDRIWL